MIQISDKDTSTDKSLHPKITAGINAHGDFGLNRTVLPCLNSA